MAELEYQAVRRNHKKFLERASQREGFKEACDSLAVEYVLASQMLKARTKAGLTQEAVAVLMGTKKSAISRLESAGKHAPSLATLKRYPEAVGCKLEIKLVRQR